MSNALRFYLTIDDSPSARSDDIVDFLKARGIPALFFCRGDYLAANPAPMVRAVEAGFILGNHLYSHQRSSRMTMAQVQDEILRTQELIEDIYARAGKVQPLKTLRFPYMDCGMGAWFVAPDDLTQEAYPIMRDLVGLGLGNDPAATPDDSALTRAKDMRAWLVAQGFAPPRFDAVTAPWFRGSVGLAGAPDTMVTISTADWMLTRRHLGKWPYDTLEALVARSVAQAADPCHEGSAHILLLHDQDELGDVCTGYVAALCNAGAEFMDIA